MSSSSPDLIHLHAYADHLLHIGAPANNIALRATPIDTPAGKGFVIAPSRLKMPVAALRDMLGTAFGHAGTFPSFSLTVVEAADGISIVMNSAGVHAPGSNTPMTAEEAETKIFDWVLSASRTPIAAVQPRASQTATSLDCT